MVHFSEYACAFRLCILTKWYHVNTNIGWQGGGHPSMVHGWQRRGPEASSSSRAQRVHSSRQTLRFVQVLLHAEPLWHADRLTNAEILPSWTPRARNIKLAPKCWWLGEWREPQENSWSQGLLLHGLPIIFSFSTCCFVILPWVARPIPIRTGW